MTNPYDFLDVLADAACEAILPHFRRGPLVENKNLSGFDPVTIADHRAEQAMRDLIARHFPADGILGEEFGPTNSEAETVWVLDPIDGTRSFIAGVPVWGVLIGHKHQGKADIGMMCQPFTGERFSSDGKDSWYQRTDKALSARTPLKTRECASLAKATLFTTSPDLFSPTEKARYQSIEHQVQFARYGLDCYAYCMVASGHADLVIESGLNAYDVAALIPIIENAGGRITTWQGDNAVNGGSIVASGSPKLHDQVLKILAQ